MRTLALYLLVSLILYSVLSLGFVSVILDGLEDEVFEDVLYFLVAQVKSSLKAQQTTPFGSTLCSHPAHLDRDLYLLDESFLI